MAHAIYFQSAAGPSGGLLAGFEIGAPTFWEMCGAAPGVVMNFFLAAKSSDSAPRAGMLQVELSESMGLNLQENVWSRIGDPYEDFWPAQDHWLAHAIYFQSAAGPSGRLLAGVDIGAPSCWEMCGAAPGVVMNVFWAVKSSDSAFRAGRLQVELSESMGLNL